MGAVEQVLPIGGRVFCRTLVYAPAASAASLEKGTAGQGTRRKKAASGVRAEGPNHQPAGEADGPIRLRDDSVQLAVAPWSLFSDVPSPRLGFNFQWSWPTGTLPGGQRGRHEHS